MKEYICECGRVFDNPQRFNGHKSNCKIHHEVKGTLDQLKEKYKKNRKGEGRKESERSQKQKLQNLKDWLSVEHICEKCGKVMTEKFGSGRFCSKSCANSHERSEESRRKTSQSMKANNVYVIYEDKKITANALDKRLKKEAISSVKAKKKQENRRNVFESIDAKNSPYSEFDCVFINQNSEIGVYYYFTKHNEQGSIVKRAICPQYRYMIEKELGRRLKRNEVVHHIDFNHFNNSRDNLTVMLVGDHVRLHNKKICASNSAARIPDFC